MKHIIQTKRRHSINAERRRKKNETIDSPINYTSILDVLVMCTPPFEIASKSSCYNTLKNTCAKR